MKTIKTFRRTSIAIILSVFSLIVSGQHWAIRSELLLTSTKAVMVQNSSPFQPFTSVYYNNPDISLSVDYFNKKKNRWSIGLGTFSTGVGIQGNRVDDNGILGFLFPPTTLKSGTSGGVQLSMSYEHLLIPKMRSNWYVGGGLNGWVMRPSDGVSSNFFLGDVIILGDSMFRANAITPGWHLRTSFAWKNKKQREVMQFMVKVNGSFGIAQHTLITRYDLLIPEQLTNQVAEYKLTGAGIQIGIGKTLIFFPRQKKRII